MRGHSCVPPLDPTLHAVGSWLQQVAPVRAGVCLADVLLLGVRLPHIVCAAQSATVRIELHRRNYAAQRTKVCSRSVGLQRRLRLCAMRVSACACRMGRRAALSGAPPPQSRQDSCGRSRRARCEAHQAAHAKLCCAADARAAAELQLSTAKTDRNGNEPEPNRLLSLRSRFGQSAIVSTQLSVS